MREINGFRIFWGIIFSTMIAMCFTYRSRLMPLLTLAVFLMCALSFISGLITKMSVNIEVAEPKSDRVFRNEKTGFSVRVKNKSILPLTPVCIYINTLYKGVYRPQTVAYIAFIPPRGEATVKVKCVTSFRGEYAIGFEKAEFYDILRTSRFCIKHKNPYVLTVYPRQPEKHNPQSDNLEESENPHTTQRGFDFKKNAFSHLREYREGESLRHIHWKLSARNLNTDGDLIVKQMESDYDNSALVFCDFTVKFDSAEEFLKATDETIETAQSVIREIVSKGDRACFISHYQNADIETMQDYRDLTEELVLLPHSPLDGEFAELLSEQTDETELERAIYIITSAVTEEFAASLQTLGLTSKKGAVLIIVPSPLNQNDMIDFLKEKMTVDDTIDN